MAVDKTISELTQNPAIDGTEEMATERGGSNYKNTLNAFRAYLQNTLTFLSAGDNVSDLTNDSGYLVASDISDKIESTDYATSTVGGTLKARLDGSTLYLTNDGTDA